jgi:tRNA (Thr-GGU) A37 N-methylase
MRPNRIGVTVCQLLSVDGRELEVRGLDAIEGSPVLDAKPYVAEFGPRRVTRQPAWASELMGDYW